MKVKDFFFFGRGNWVNGPKLGRKMRNGEKYLHKCKYSANFSHLPYLKQLL